MDKVELRGCFLTACFFDAGEFAFVGHFADADAAQAEEAVVAAGAATAAATVVVLHGELVSACGFHDEKPRDFIQLLLDFKKRLN